MKFIDAFGGKNMTWQASYLNRFYRSRVGWIDGTAEFWALCRESIPARGRVLEIGAGPTNSTSRFLAENYDLDGVTSTRT